MRDWQYRLGKRISRLESDGFAMVMQDEAFFIHDVITGRKYWTPKGQRINVPYTGSHKKITAYGALAKDGMPRGQGVLQACFVHLATPRFVVHAWPKKGSVKAVPTPYRLRSVIPLWAIFKYRSAHFWLWAVLVKMIRSLSGKNQARVQRKMDETFYPPLWAVT